jgi:D-arabinose 1-dehydrogenase-like Zn-dependent alcohol dehydrogenase
MGPAVGDLSPRGELVVVGVASEPLPISSLHLISPALSVKGHPAGSARDVEETVHFAVLSGVRAHRGTAVDALPCDAPYLTQGQTGQGQNARRSSRRTETLWS